MRQKVYKTETCVPGECWSDGEAAGMCKWRLICVWATKVHANG
jgi:hypothetical protein